MKKDLQCPICEEGNLLEQVGKNHVDYKGETTELDLCFSVCNSCGSEQANAQQVRTNKRQMVAFKKRVDNLLTGSEVRSIREKLELKQSDAANIFGGGPVAFSKYENDDITQSEAMDKLLRVAVEIPEAFVYLARHSRVHVTVHIDRKTRDQTSWHILSSGCLIGSAQRLEIHKYVNSPLGSLDRSIYEVPFEKAESMQPIKVKLSHHYEDFNVEYDAC